MTKSAPFRPDPPKTYKIGFKYFPDINPMPLDQIINFDGKFPHLFYKNDPSKHPKLKNSLDQCYYASTDGKYRFIGREHEDPIPTQDITETFHYTKLILRDEERYKALEEASFNPLCSHCNNIATYLDFDALSAQKEIDYDYVDSVFDLSDIDIFLCDFHKNQHSVPLKWSDLANNSLALLKRLHVMACDLNTIVRKRFKEIPTTLKLLSQLKYRLDVLIKLADQCMLPDNAIFAADLNSLMNECAGQLVDANYQKRFESIANEYISPIEVLNRSAPTSVDQVLLARIMKYREILNERSDSFNMKIRETAETQIFANNFDMMIFPAIIDLLSSENENDPEVEKIRDITSMQSLIWLMGNYHMIGAYIRNRIPASIPDIIVFAYALDL